METTEFGELFRRFLDDVVNAAPAPESELVGLLKAHFGADPLELPVVAQSFQMVEHANVQVALEEYIAQPGRTADMLGLAGQTAALDGPGVVRSAVAKPFGGCR